MICPGVCCMEHIRESTFSEFRYMTMPLLSPSGKHTAFVVSEADIKGNCYRSDIYMVNNTTRELRRLTSSGRERAFSWLPDGRILLKSSGSRAVERTHAEGRPYTEYTALDISTGSPDVVAGLPLISGFPTVLKDGRWLVSGRVDLYRPDFTALPEDERAQAIAEYENPRYEIIDEVPFWADGGSFTSHRRNSLFLCDPADGSAERITPPLFNVMSSHCAFGKVLYCGIDGYGMHDYRRALCLYDIDTGESRVLLPQGVYDIVQAVIVDADTAIVRLLTAEDSPYSEGQFYRLGLSSGELTWIADYDYKSEFCSLIGDVTLGMGQPYKAAGGKLYFVTVEGEDSYIRCIDKFGRISERLTNDGVAIFLDTNGRQLVYQGHKGDLLNELYIVDSPRMERRLTHLNDFVQEKYIIAPRHPLRFTDKDGFDIHGFVIPPAGYEPGVKYPGVLYVHGGPRGTSGADFNNDMQVYAGYGYFVMYCNPRGSAGRGKEFADLKGGMGGFDFDDLMGFTDAALAAWPDIDADRLGIVGGSYGGYIVNWAIGHTGRFACAVADRSISNWATMEGTSDMGHFNNKQQFGCWLEEDTAHIWRISPLKYAHRAVTPTLFIHSDCDYRCPMTEALQMYSILMRHGVDSRIVLFHGESHSLAREGGPANRLTRLHEIVNWFNTYLKS